MLDQHPTIHPEGLARIDRTAKQFGAVGRTLSERRYCSKRSLGTTIRLPLTGAARRLRHHIVRRRRRGGRGGCSSQYHELDKVMTPNRLLNGDPAYRGRAKTSPCWRSCVSSLYFRSRWQRPSTLALPRGTSRARLESYAIATAALLKADRDSAVRHGTQVATKVDAASRLISSGITERVVQIPDDVEFDALLAAHCAAQPTRSTIRFFSSGMSCGGAIALTRQGFGYEVRVNWLTGRVEVVAINPAPNGWLLPVSQ